MKYDKGNRGLNIPKRLLKVGMGALAAFVLFYGAMDYWVEQQRLPAIPISPVLPKAANAAYSIAPRFYSEREIGHVIKLGSILAVSSLTETSMRDKAETVGTAFGLLDRYLRFRPTDMDPDAVAELALERAIIFNRASGMIFPNGLGRRQDVVDLLDASAMAASDGETKVTAKRELMISRYLDQGASREIRDAAARDLDSVTQTYARHSSSILAANAYYYGLVGCISGAEHGAASLESALQMFSGRTELIYLVGRNFDAPLIALARERSGCEKELTKIINLIGANNG